MSEVPLQLEEVVKEFPPFRAVDKVSFQINPGEIFGLLGPNGAGKTSIISMITTLLRPTSGVIRIFGVNNIKEPRRAKAQIGTVPQELIHHGYFSVIEVIEFYSSYHGIRKNTAHIECILKRLDLWTHRNKLVNNLSGGMKRRLLIAKVLVHKPKLLLLDEPTAGVDIELKESLWELVKELREDGTSILLTTHYLEEAENLCDRVGIINYGKLLRVDNLSDLMNDYGKRIVTLQLTKPIPPLTHSALHLQDNTTIVFHVPRQFNIGLLLQESQIDSTNISDIHIREGKLEDVFRDILKNNL